MHFELNEKPRINPWFSILGSILIALETPCLSAEWIESKVSNPSGGNIHTDAADMSEILGMYPTGTLLYVWDIPKSGFHTIYLKTPLNGSHYAWISESDLELTQRQPSSQDFNSPTATSSSNERVGTQTLQQPQTPREVESNKQKTWFFTPSLGYSQYKYQQQAGTISFAGPVGHVNLDWRPPSLPVKVSAGASYTSLPASLRGATFTNQWIRTFVTAGIVIKLGSACIDFSGGALYQSLTVSLNNFGYNPLMLPGLFPALTWNFYGPLELTAKMAYASNFRSPLATTEQGGGAGLSWQIGNGQKITAQFNYLVLYQGNANSTVFTQTTQSFTLGYTF
jgi:hypothetical protein